MEIMDRLLVALILALYAMTAYFIEQLVNTFQDKAYMDEIFHIPQAQHYCNGNFSQWDPMITTLPGLYLTSASILLPASRLLNIPASEICSTRILRSINPIFMLGNVLVFYLITNSIHAGKQISPFHSILNALSLGFYPVLYFTTTFLYYTDPGAVFWVLLMYLASLKKAHKMAALCGLISVVFRQTNIVWVIFMAGLSTEEHLVRWMSSTNKKSKSINVQNLSAVLVFLQQIRTSLISRDKKLAKLFLSVFISAFPYFVIVNIFVAFLYFNDGIVLGDRSHHTACFNFPQIFYFLSSCLVFSAVHMIRPMAIINFFKTFLSNPFSIGIFVGVSTYVIAKFTYAHKYLLADNRHYTFYIWSKIYRRHEMAKFVLIPVYLYAFITFVKLLHHKTVFWKLYFAVCLLVSLVPQQLMEFRYFILPFYLWRLNIQMPSRFTLLSELIVFLVINAATIYLFLYRPFKWENSNDVQRFMW